MSTKTFQQACAALWGPQWRSEAARQLGIARSSVVRYDNGERVIPPALFVHLSTLLAERQGEIGVLWPKLLRAAGEDGERLVRKLLRRKETA